MTFKITSSHAKIMDPFAVAFIIIGLTIILARIVEATGGNVRIIKNVGLMVGLITGGTYSLITLKDRYRQGGLDRLLYFLIPSAIFGAAIFFGVGACYEFGWLTTG